MVVKPAAVFGQQPQSPQRLPPAGSRHQALAARKGQAAVDVLPFCERIFKLLFPSPGGSDMRLSKVAALFSLALSEPTPVPEAAFLPPPWDAESSGLLDN